MRQHTFYFLIFLTACSSYPRRWFKEVSKTNAPSWEILPQEAAQGEVILSKRNELGILSNFAPTPFTYKGKRYASVEGFWQMMKFPENEQDPRFNQGLKFTRKEVSQMSAFEAKEAGTKAEIVMKKLGIDWVTFEGKKMAYCSESPGLHYKLIKEAMWEKLQQNKDVTRVLKSTGDLKLLPDHHPESCRAPEWKYYEIWMEYRDKLTAQ